MNFDLRKSTIFLTLVGSRAYGFSSESSDWDYRGICIPPLNTYIGINSKFEQVVDTGTSKQVWKHYPELVKPEADMQIMELTKFCRLALECNPSIIEILFSDESSIVYKHPVMDVLLENREMFLSKRAKARFCGYALSQLERIKRHKIWLDSEEHNCQLAPTRLEFGLPEVGVISTDQIGAADALIKQEIDGFMSLNQDELPEHVKIELNLGLSRMVRGVWQAINASPYPVGKGKTFESTQEALENSALSKGGYCENFIETLKKEKRYRAAYIKWTQYQNWLRDRNPDRAALEKKFGYDCYVEETEFLTENGWKKFDQISEMDKLATVNTSTFKVEYQNYIDKFDGIFNGNLYNLYGNHLDVLVTPNHRMLVRKIERKSGKTFNWTDTQISLLPDTFEIVRTITPNKKRYSTDLSFNDIGLKPKPYLRLMGWYLSDGCMEFDHHGNVTNINIDQKKGGKCYWSMTRFYGDHRLTTKASWYEYISQPNEFRNYEIKAVKLSIRDKDICNKLYRECSIKSAKRIPRYVMSLSKDMMEELLDALIDGDGTQSRPDDSKIYYSSSKDLANDVQELAFMCGFETSLYGPYKQKYEYKDHIKIIDMYQVHINKTRTQFKKCIRNSNIKKISVNDKKIVCFTVPNDTLITRYNGHIGLHRNSKHACHLVRLIRMCREILETGQVLVKRPDAEELRAIRNGAWSYDKICQFAETEDLALNDIMKKSKLSTAPDMEKIQSVVYQMVLRFNGMI